MKNIFFKIPELCSSRHGLVLATVTGTKGSTPQKPGSSALFDSGILIAGTVGGGIVEGRVAEFAAKCSQTKKSGWITHHLDNDISHKEDAICGGEISVLVDGNPCRQLEVFKEIRDSIAARMPGILISLVTREDDGNVSVERQWMTADKLPVFPADVIENIRSEASDILSSAVPEFRQIDISVPGIKPWMVLLEPVFPQKQLVIAGAGHIGKALSHLGKMLDFDVTVIDDRKEYANRENLPDADSIIVSDIGPAMEEIKKGSDSFIVIVTRGHKDDAEALRPCIGSGAAYVGMIGSKIKVARIRDEFIRNNWASEEQWKKIFSPVGLDIKSKTVEEIALSIAAQMVLVRNS
ncbi:MAG TPA: XdhC/CoxI family protein [Bacteroidales bacterium]|nr:XdhC/CoxI family protein [Bacteroidales bacterium]